MGWPGSTLGTDGPSHDVCPLGLLPGARVARRRPPVSRRT